VSGLGSLHCCATALFNFRPRCARFRPAVVASRYRRHFALLCGEATSHGWSPPWTDTALRAYWNLRSGPAAGIMDPHRRDPCRDGCVVARIPAPRGSFELGPSRGSRRRIGPAWTWRMVSRCAAVWMETGRAAGPKELAFTPFSRNSPFLVRGPAKTAIVPTPDRSSVHKASL